ncbi:MAG: response regulator [Nanoarchaeota archaeon]|nr:response regulator [Nanoarchaeota archaeon]
MGKRTRKNLKILIVDDDEKSLKLLKAILEMVGFEHIIAASNGKECFTLAQDELPDLIFLDIMMPEMDGASVRSDLLNNEKTKNIPVVFSTAIVTDEEVKNTNGVIGKDLFVAKPYDSGKINRAIYAALGAI